MSKTAGKAPFKGAKATPETPWTIPTQPADVQQGAQNQAIGVVLASLLGGAALGGGVTGLSGWLKRRSQPQPPSMPQELEMPIPVPEKQAAGKQVDLTGKTVPFTSGWSHGTHAAGPLDFWWTIPAAAGAGAAGTLGMSALVEHLMKQKRKAELESQYQDAQQQFQQSMLGQFKKGSADILDELFDRVEKRAAFYTSEQGLSSNMNDWIAPALGVGLTGGGILAYLAAKGAYKSQEGRTNEDLLAKALKQRAYLRSLQSPPPVVFRPQPVPSEE